MTNKNERIKQLNKLLDKYAGKYTAEHQNIIWDTINHIQTLLEFSFLVQKYENIPLFKLGEEDSEEDTNKSLEYKKPLIFLRLTKRCYAPLDDNSKKLFDKESVLLASVPVMWKTYFKTIENKNGESERYPIRRGIFRTDNEFVLTLKTKTLKEQYEIINILERTFNIYAKKFYSNFIHASGIVKFESRELKDKDDLKTIDIYFQLRLKEIIDLDDTFILKAFTIFRGRDDIFEIDGSGNHFEPPKEYLTFPPINNK